MMVMIFGQLSGRNSLRDLLVSINAHSSKYYHLGFGKGVSRSNLASANETRDYRIYQSLAEEMIASARASIKNPDFLPDVDGNVYALDSTTIDLCLSVFWWAGFRKAKGGIKLHTLYDVRTSIPCYVRLTDALTHDVKALDNLSFEPSGYYVMDKAYLDFDRLYRVHLAGAYYVTRPKDNARFKRRFSSPADKEHGIICDQTVVLSGYVVGKKYPEAIRRVKYFDKELQQTFVFITNNFELTAIEIAALYKQRWQVELFFKWIKQHLQITTFWGTTINAVKCQVYIAIITYTLVSILKNKLKTGYSIYEILQILSVSLLDKTPLNQLLQATKLQDETDPDCNSMQISLF